MDVVRRAPQRGWIEVITGSMFSGKSEKTDPAPARAEIARQKVQIFKPILDDRFSEHQIVSHSNMRIGSENVGSADQLVERVSDDAEVVRDRRSSPTREPLQAAHATLADRGKRVIVAGLDQDYLGRPFEASIAAAARRGPEVHHRDAGNLRRPAEIRRITHPAARSPARTACWSRAGGIYEGSLPQLLRSVRWPFTERGLEDRISRWACNRISPACWSACSAAGFLIANTRLILEIALQFRRRRRGALLIWPSPKPPYHATALAIGVVLGLLVFYKLVVLHRQVFGEAMMFLYYAYLLPLNLRIRRGFYEDGIWADTSFIPYSEVGVASAGARASIR